MSTREWGVQMSRTNTVLDPPCWRAIESILMKSADIHPGGLVHGISLEYGSTNDDALVVGSVCEMFYAGCSVTDDIQDGDSDKYLGDYTLAEQINAQLQLLSLVSLRLDSIKKTSRSMSTVRRLYETLSIMLTGQRYELVRSPWNIEIYEKVARLSAGEQFATYFELALIPTQYDHSMLKALGITIGMLLQVIADIETRDDRFLLFPKEERRMFVKKIVDESILLSQNIPASIKVQVEELVNRCGQSVT